MPNNDNDDRQCLVEIERTNEDISLQIRPTQPILRNYGSLSTGGAPNPFTTTTRPAPPPPPPLDHLTYSWSNIDVFGEVSQSTPFAASIANRLRVCCGKRHKNPTPRKHLLKNVSGIARPGELLAIMGSSGAGKTTLLNSLAFRSPPGIQISQSARRSLNGVPIGSDELRSRCAYVQQEDLFIGTLTAKEHLVFQAMLRMDRNMSQKQKLARVDEVLRELSMTDCKDTIIGVLGRTKGLSGGERKRLSFASESLTDPSLLFCDEPTSGLDSFMADTVLQVLKKLAVKGKTIVVTIHQPSSELYALFDKLMLMAEGRVAFLGSPAEATTFFDDSLNTPCPTNYNPADFYVQLLAVVPGHEAHSLDTIRRICDAYASSDLAKRTDDLVALNSNRRDRNSFEEIAVRKMGGFGLCKATWCTQFRVILWRSWISMVKEPMLVRVRLIQTIIIAFIIGIIFFGQVLDQDGVMNLNGAVFLFLTNMTFQNVFSVINVFCVELPVFLREHRSNLYRTDTYFLGKTIAELPLFILIPILFVVIVYPMIGLRMDVGSFFVAMAIIVLVANVSTSFGYAISCASSSLSMALSVGPPLIIPMLLFGGYFLNNGSVPWYLTWVSYLSWFRYANEGLMVNQWAQYEQGEIACTRANASCPTSGHIVLETLNFNEANLPLDFFGLLMLIVGFRVLAFSALAFRTRSKE